MPVSFWELLSDPILWLFLAVIALIVYRLSGARRRLLRRRRAALRVQASRADSLRERRELMLKWNELGGLRERERLARQRSAREQGQKARAAGRPLSANPYAHGLWGNGRLWKRGWKAVDRHIRWIERHRG
ncbi:MAG TPA: hypothetical protein VGC20_03850 [bacterium]